MLRTLLYTEQLQPALSTILSYLSRQ